MLANSRVTRATPPPPPSKHKHSAAGTSRTVTLKLDSHIVTPTNYSETSLANTIIPYIIAYAYTSRLKDIHLWLKALVAFPVEGMIC